MCSHKHFYPVEHTLYLLYIYTDLFSDILQFTVGYSSNNQLVLMFQMSFTPQCIFINCLILSLLPPRCSLTRSLLFIFSLTMLKFGKAWQQGYFMFC